MILKHLNRILLFACLALTAACSGEPLEQLYQGVDNHLMNTRVEVWVVTADGEKARAAIREALGEIRRIERLMSKYDEQSEVSRLNKSASLKVSPDTFRCIDLAVQTCRATDGAFDATVAPVLDVWRRAAKRQRMPRPSELELACHLVGSVRKLRLDPLTKRVSFAYAGMKLDLGGIAKGYAVDRAIDKLRLKGIKSGYVNAGGDIYFLGRNLSGKPWAVKIFNPFEEDGEPPLDRMALADSACVTSGHYNRFTQIGNRRISHIVDPRTGQPVSETASVTVIAPTAAQADALATAMSVMKPDESIKLAQSMAGVEVFIVTGGKEKGKIYKSARWDQYRREK